MTNMILILISLSLIFLTLILYLPQKTLYNRTLISSFECGFNPFHNTRLPFSLQFFLITVIFLIFDIEIVILLPLPLLMNSNLPLMFFMSILILLIILLAGTYYEWTKGALNWVY